MVKLFVGNLTESSSSRALKNLFQQHKVQVDECAVIKNFAFVHVPTEAEADKAIRELNKCSFEGREIHIERSNTKPRRNPIGNDSRSNSYSKDNIRRGPPSNKRRSEGVNDSPKRSRIASHDIGRPNLNALQMQGSNPNQPQCWGYRMGGSNEVDPELLPCPENPDLQLLYEQYKDARTRFIFYKDRLIRELNSSTNLRSDVRSFEDPSLVKRVDLTYMSSRQQAQPQPLNAIHQPNPTSVLVSIGSQLAPAQPMHMFSRNSLPSLSSLPPTQQMAPGAMTGNLQMRSENEFNQMGGIVGLGSFSEQNFPQQQQQQPQSQSSQIQQLSNIISNPGFIQHHQLTSQPSSVFQQPQQLSNIFGPSGNTYTPSQQSSLPYLSSIQQTIDHKSIEIEHSASKIPSLMANLQSQPPPQAYGSPATISGATLFSRDLPNSQQMISNQSVGLPRGFGM